MKRYVAVALLAFMVVATPCQGQFLKKLGDTLLNGQGQQGLLGGQQAQPTLIGNVNLPPGQYMMTNVQSGQAFYVAVQNGQMYLTSSGGQQMMPGQGMMQQPGMMPQQGVFQQPGMMPQQQQGGMGGMIKDGLGNFLRNQMAPQPVQGQ